MLKELKTATQDLFFPLLCLKCARKIRKGWLCPACRQDIKILLIPDCYSRAEIKINSCYAYQGPMQALISHFKYKRSPYLAEFLAQLMLKQLKAIKFNPLAYDFITAVPLHPYKMKLRGYNQAELLAEIIANYFKLPLKSDIISSDFSKNSQTKLTLQKRKKNVAGKFKVKKDLKNKNIIIIDDVLTTGATILACGKALKEKKAGQIRAITLAKQNKN